MIYHLLYISQKSKNTQDSQLEDIIDKSRHNNAREDITGLLIQKGDFFIQLLEGNKSKVTSLYNRILADPRHFRARIIYSGESDKKIFPEWEMGLIKEPTEKSLSEIIPKLHTEINKHQEIRAKIVAALKEFNS